MKIALAIVIALIAIAVLHLARCAKARNYVLTNREDFLMRLKQEEKRATHKAVSIETRDRLSVLRETLNPLICLTYTDKKANWKDALNTLTMLDRDLVSIVSDMENEINSQSNKKEL